MNHGMEDWHPNPDFFFKPGGGPILDLGPYYITNLVQLIGPVKHVAAIASTPALQRVITSQPRAGETIAVETPTTFHALLEFESGATVTLGASWDVWKHGHAPMELYGELVVELARLNRILMEEGVYRGPRDPATSKIRELIEKIRQ